MSLIDQATASMRIAGLIFSVVVLFGRSAVAQAPPAPQTAAMRSIAAACNEPAYHALDFWVGEWDVYDSQDGTRAGHSVLEKILNGCAIEVNWIGVEGEHVKELFYYDKPKQQWVQVWVGDGGATKQRRLLERLHDGSVRFQGEVAQMNGGSHLDRSTVTSLPNGRVHQVIEISRDGGKSWQPSFDAEYRRSNAKGSSNHPGLPGVKGVRYDSD